MSMFGDVTEMLTRDEEDEKDDDLDMETKLLCLDIKEFEANSRNIVVGVKNPPGMIA